MLNISPRVEQNERITILTAVMNYIVVMKMKIILSGIKIVKDR